MNRKKRSYKAKQTKHIYHTEKTSGLRVAWAVSIIAILVYISTEFLSLFHAINTICIRGFWLICILGTVISVTLKKRCQQNGNVKKETKNGNFTSLNQKWFICIPIIAWLFFLGYFSYKTVPCNYDSMTYHLARVANWIQNQSVAYYKTNIPRQLFSPVFSEYVILHLCLICENDIPGNLVQYVSYVLNLYFLWDILKKSGFSDQTAILASGLFGTMPIAIAQSMTTQVDLNGCMWLLLFIDVLLELMALEKLELCPSHIKLVFLCAVSVVFGYLTKSNVCFVMLVFLIWLLCRCIKRKDDTKCLLIYTGIAGAVILVFASPTFIRNYLYTGSAFASSYMSDIMTGTLNPLYLLVNIYKNFILLAATEPTRTALTSFGKNFAKLFGIDIDAPEISNTGNFCDNLSISYSHDTANNPVIAWLFLISVIIFLLLILFKKQVEKKTFIGICLLSVLVALASLRYQTWGSRLLLPALAIMCLTCAMILENSIVLLLKNKSKNRLFAIILLLSIIAAIPALHYNTQYAVKYKENNNRFKMYFAITPMYPQYKGICEFVESLNVHKIGILVGLDDYEYPLWVRLKKKDTTLIQVVEGNNAEVPECIIAINQNMAIGKEYSYNGKQYTSVYNYKGKSFYAVLIPK